jgi:KDO2-lipid IV(A) lauroyltransferase
MGCLVSFTGSRALRAAAKACVWGFVRGYPFGQSMAGFDRRYDENAMQMGKSIGVMFRLIDLAIKLMSCIPFKTAILAGKALGSIAYHIPMSRKYVALENIRKSFPYMTEAEAKRLLRHVFIHFGRVLLEIPHIRKLTRKNLIDYADFAGEENLEDALSKGKGVFVLTAHFGNWELMCAAVSLRLGRAAVVARPLDFVPMDRVINGLRSRFGAVVIPHKAAARRIIGTLRENMPIGIMLDQKVDWYEGAFVPFFGRWACTNKGLAVLALRTGAPVVPAFSVRQDDGRYRIIFEEEVELHRTGDKLRDVEDNTESFTRIIERYIRKNPDHWFWFHKRWNTKNYCELII